MTGPRASARTAVRSCPAIPAAAAGAAQAARPAPELVINHERSLNNASSRRGGAQHEREDLPVHSIIYIIGLVVVIAVILSFLGLT